MSDYPKSKYATAVPDTYTNVDISGSATKAVIHYIDVGVIYSANVAESDTVVIRVNGRVIKTMPRHAAERLGIVGPNDY